MSAHTHKTVVPGCYRCDLNRDEIGIGEQDDREALAEVLYGRFASPWLDHWSDLDEGQRRNTEAWEIAEVVFAAGFRRTPAPYDHPEGYVAQVPLAWVLETYRDGDECGWDAEFEFLRRDHSEQIDRLATSVQETGIQEPILLGSDGRVWDGHHRLCVAATLGLASVPVLLPTRPPAPPQVNTVALVSKVAEALSQRAEWPSLHWPDVSCMQHADVAKAFAETIVQVVSAVLYRPEGGEE